MIPTSYNSNNVHSEEVKQSPKLVTNNYFSKENTHTEERHPIGSVYATFGSDHGKARVTIMRNLAKIPNSSTSEKRTMSQKSFRISTSSQIFDKVIRTNHLSKSNCRNLLSEPMQISSKIEQKIIDESIINMTDMTINSETIENNQTLKKNLPIRKRDSSRWMNLLKDDETSEGDDGSSINHQSMVMG